MKGDKIKYKEGYKYQLAEDYGIQTNIIPRQPIITPFIELGAGGFLIVKKGYAWDGPSGPTIDSKSFMRGSLVHDAFYQLMRDDYLGQHYREAVDVLMRDMCMEDGMYAWRAEYVYHAVRMFAQSAANAENERETITAP